MATGDELASVETWLVEWFVGRSKITKSASHAYMLREMDYFEAGWLTSMEVVEFVMEIEQKFGVSFSDRDLQDQRFSTIAGLTGLILEHTAQVESGR
jgi:acyl carrier protein